MATQEKDVLLQKVDEDGNLVCAYPITRAENVSGLDERIIAHTSDATAAEVGDHLENGDIHVTPEDKELWNNGGNAAHTHSNKDTLDKVTETDLTKLAGVEDNANNYAHPTTSGNKHIPSGGSANQILRYSSDGTAVWDDESEGVDPSTATPLVAGTAAVGTENAYARGDHVHPAQTSVTGTAGSANTLTTARTIGISGGATGTATSFNGSANITIPVTGLNVSTATAGTLALNRGGTGAATAAEARTNLEVPPTSHASTATTYGVGTASNYGHAMASSATPLVAGTANVGTDNGKYAREGHVHPAQTSVTGTAGTANALTTARNIALTGDVTGAVSFNGAADASITSTLANSGVTAGSYGPTAAVSLGAGGAFNVPQVTVDAKGRATSVANRAVTLPAAYSHPTFTASTIGPSANATLAYGGTFVVPQVGRDANGHASTLTAHTMTMPAAPTSVATLNTARYFSTTGAVTGTATAFNGSANVAIPTTALNVSYATAGTLPIARGGTGATTVAAALTALGAAASNHTHNDMISADMNPVQIGEGANASGTNSTALGHNANAGGYLGTALGYFANAGGSYSTALGYYANATTGTHGTALGAFANAGGYNGTALGGSAKASGSSSTALGHYAQATGNYSTALGWNAKASGTSSTALGLNAAVAVTSSTALGYFAVTANANSIQLGNATSLSTITARVGITATSDERDKADIKPIDKSLDFLRKIEPVQYVFNHRELYEPKELTPEQEEKKRKYGLSDYDKEEHAKATKKGERKRVGLKAKQVQDALEEVYETDNYADVVMDNLYDMDDVPEDVESQLSITYTSLIPFLIGAVKELSEKVEQLEDKVHE